MNINTKMLKEGNFKKYDRLYDSQRNYLGSIIEVDFKKMVVLIKYRIHFFPLDINKIK